MISARNPTSKFSGLCGQQHSVASYRALKLDLKAVLIIETIGNIAFNM